MELFTHHLAQYKHTEFLEDLLGDPGRADNVVSFRNALTCDEAEQLPLAALDRLKDLGLRRSCVPERLGGELRSCEELFMTTRALARRDMNLAVSESTQVWSMLMWIAGDDEQQRRLAEAMLGGDVVPCLAYSEAEHGADLLANELTATPTAEGYVLTGEKWPVNRAASSTHAVVLARTGASGAGLAQSLFLVEKARIDPDRVRSLPRVTTLGLRGCDISGIVFDGAPVQASSRIGPEGRGLELALRGLTLTRTICTGLSLGVADTMLRTAVGHLDGRQLYGAPVTRIPHARETLANVYLSILVAECAAITAMRGLHLFPGEFSAWSSMVKIQVPRLVDHGARALARILGARYYLRPEAHRGIFQKMLRDGGVVAMFDGSEPVCLDGLAVQLAAMARARRRARTEDWDALYDLRAPLPEFRPERTQAYGGGRDAVFASLPALCERLDALKPSGDCDEERLASLRTLTRRLSEQVDELFDGVLAGRAEPEPEAARSWIGKHTPTWLIRAAELCCALHASVTCLGLWLHNRDHLGPFFADGAWLEAALARPHGSECEFGELTPAATEQLFRRMTDQHDSARYFSLLPLRQAAPRAAEADRTAPR
ncbi:MULTISPECIES: acyl-CoA dehydrogenase family protein [unclassified Streptomyces]|uniref:acyl-CoA dehydrogenase family protein n=1 Tax=unclassified Streptomyces TaxID=2593676 RepID=UPI000F7081F2|nr:MULTISPECIES: acyl-CoA dehydrogenase family protein [unclassified Streptomyces]AZM62124.1 peptide synthetase [Streptomyces sp. WAC 01438]RSN00042.1 peptide synthetase [Streptomyces sp. WAC 01420]